MAGETYKIVRYYKRRDVPSKVMDRGLTLEDAKRHCQGPDSKGRDPRKGEWFEGFTREG